MKEADLLSARHKGTLMKVVRRGTTTIKVHAIINTAKGVFDEVEESMEKSIKLLVRDSEQNSDNYFPNVASPETFKLLDTTNS